MTANRDPYNLIVCGVGGQGNILISRMIGRILADKGYYITIGETFGAAQRGGSVYSSLRISKKRNYGPLVPQGRGHLILSLEPLETLRMLTSYGNEQVVTISNTQAIQPVGVLAKRNDYPGLDELTSAIDELSSRAWFVNVTQKAMELDSPIVANIILLGCLLGAEQLPIQTSEVEREMQASFPPDKLAVNLQALSMGREAI